MLWKNPARRDKQWNYIALQFQRYTKHVPPIQNIYGHVDNVWGIPIPKRMVPKYRFLSELSKEKGIVDLKLNQNMFIIVKSVRFLLRKFNWLNLT
jgi:hypothetical protein